MTTMIGLQSVSTVTKGARTVAIVLLLLQLQLLLLSCVLAVQTYLSFVTLQLGPPRMRFSPSSKAPTSQNTTGKLSCNVEEPIGETCHQSLLAISSILSVTQELAKCVSSLYS